MAVAELAARSATSSPHAGSRVINDDCWGYQLQFEGDHPFVSELTIQMPQFLAPQSN
jgi:hypothetical protein